MSDYKHLNLKAECLNLQNIIADLIHIKGTDLTQEEEHSLCQARRWLGNLVDPLNDKELNEWGDIAREHESEMMTEISFLLNDADRRDALNYMKGE